MKYCLIILSNSVGSSNTTILFIFTRCAFLIEPKFPKPIILNSLKFKAHGSFLINIMTSLGSGTGTHVPFRN